jgi:outer membrane protein
MRRLGLLLLCLAGVLPAEVRVLSLKEAVAVALRQSPDVMLARLDEQKAEQSVRLARSPFIPRVVVGSGLAYSNGLPMSIEGATPSLFQASAIGSVFNRPQSYKVAAAREARRGAAIDAAAKQEEVVYRTAAAFLDVENAARTAEVSRREVDTFARVVDTVRARVAEGRELPIEIKKAELNLARARYRADAMEAAEQSAATGLAALLGFEPDDQVRPAPGEREPPPLPGTADTAVEEALKSSKELRSLESKLLAKNYDVRSERAARWPRVDLVAQYAMLARYNNYDKFFSTFQRNNGQIGVSFQVPLWSGPAINAAAAREEAEAAQIKVQIRTARARITADTRRAYDDVRQSQAAQEIAKMDLDLARDQVSVLLAQVQEGRAPMRQLQEARAAESDKWIAFYDAATNLEKARLAVLRQVGGLIAALR